MRGSQSRLNGHLTDEHLKTLKDKVLSEIERIQNRQYEAKMKIANAEAGGDEVDSANENILKHSELRFATRETLYLKKLNKTLKQIDSEDYGMCEDCGSSITFTRLMARPTSTMCIGCKEESERDEQQSFHGRRSKSLGTQLNMQTRI
jgi:RNA polymerase-binding protein DksA